MSYDIAKKIRQLVAQAESETALGNSEFADNIMQKVRQMLERHGLSLLTIATALSDDPVECDREATKYWMSDNWMGNLTFAVGKFYGVNLVYGRGSASPNLNVVHAIGRESCRAAYSVMMPYLRAEVMRLAKKRVADKTYRSTSIAKRAIANALTVRIYRLCRERDEAASRTHLAGGLNALVPVDVIKVIADREFPDVHMVPSRGFKTSGSARQDAEGIQLVDQVAGEGTLKIA